MSESVRTWLIASAIMVAVWAGMALVTGEGIYPWFLWPVGIWGAIELFSWMSRRGERQRGERG
ncbi:MULTISPECIES: hypothetical protein [unclassified Crossiella]|uniref:hypothetical protein n=1 Tax=unclassified Crossiella TaxID=2620835 RepID=UPI00207C6142|nr:MULTISPECIES: hypothetical protein [unclassified Crossiella]MCO1576447.1 hypothetical protein [Crossiella sp. SN42]WHT18898.1 hypothetical protein N8J89_38330 [Crossiella sp. CA-258035]